MGTGQKVVFRSVYYKRIVKGSTVGFWDRKFSDHMFLFANMENVERAIEIYKKRMRLEYNLREIKVSISINKIVNKDIDELIKMMGLALTGRGIG
ncbi:MAG: hypothetical protein NZ901_10835 [Geminocystis sp.]|nr:hypothetical protein [Geminocystis sp.]MCS7148670.1 hypothetical protein [Geminocystis sp.]MDW8115084.1 hypothetical protein [Geminocystis sp.]MDW8464350.1 hypothetical protein [Geminocystis sp.]